MRIAFVVGTLTQGGAERQLVYMLKALRVNGAEIHVFCLTKDEYWESYIKELDIPVFWIGQSGSKGVRLLRIVHALRPFTYDIVQSSHFYTNLYATAAGRVLGLPEIGAIRSDAVYELKSNGRVFGNLSLRMPRMLAVNSMRAIENARASGVRKEKLFFLPNVVDTSHFSPGTPRDGATIRLLSVGRLIEDKRVDLFLRVLAKIRSGVDLSVTGTVVGEGPERASLERLAAQLGLLSAGVTFTGNVSDAGPLYRQHDVLLLTSLREGTPNVVLEAMASGLPVVSTAVGDVPNIIRNGETGFVVGLQDEEALAQAVAKLVRDHALRRAMGDRAHNWIRQHRSVDRLAGFLGDLYAIRRDRQFGAT